MNAALLLKHFDRLAEAPDAVPRLRRFILDLAVRGKLVEQNPDHEPASELLKRIEAEKARLVKAGEIRKSKNSGAVGLDEQPHRLPDNWCWTRIRHIAVPREQTVPEQAFSYIDVGSIDKERGRVSEAKILRPDEAPSRARKIVRTGDVIYSCVRPYLLNVAVIDEELDPLPIASTAFAVLNGLGFVLPRYQWIVLRSPYMVALVEGKMRGQAYPAINDTDFARLVFPLPPLAEQHRIVAKVDELMALCDRLEAAQAERETRRERLTAASLHRLRPTTDENPSRPNLSDLNFHLSHLRQTTTHPDHLAALREAIKEFAVRGALVQTAEDDESADDLLERISPERRRLSAQSGSRHVPYEPIATGPFSLPSRWRWVRFGDLIYASDAGWSPRTETFPRSANQWGVLKVSAVSWDEFRPEENKQLLPDAQPREAARVRNGDFLISRANTSDLVAKAVVVEGEHTNLMLSDKIVRLHIVDLCDRRFLMLVNNSARYARAYYAAQATGTSASMQNVSRSTIYNLPLPLPPLAEQRRIVEKVDELMAVCDRLEDSLRTGRETSRRLLEAVLRDALQPALEEVAA